MLPWQCQALVERLEQRSVCGHQQDQAPASPLLQFLELDEQANMFAFIKLVCSKV